MNAIENEAWVEAVARAICTEISGRCMCVSHNAFQHAHCDYPKRSAIAAIRALFPLIIERCATEAEEESCDNSKAGRLDEAFGAMGASNRIRALIQKEASDA